MGCSAENSRTSLRLLARHEETGFSNASILNSMERFVKSVNEMEETILVPSRLLDLAVGDATDTTTTTTTTSKTSSSSQSSTSSKSSHNKSTTKDALANTDLYRLYDILNRMKVELLWSQDHNDDKDDDGTEQPNEFQSNNHQYQQEHKPKPGHARHPSTASMQSVQSASSIVSSSDDSESDAGIENDSGLESEQEPRDRLTATAEHFRRHLRGLHRCIDRMTEAAEYLTHRYQIDVGGQV